MKLLLGMLFFYQNVIYKSRILLINRSHKSEKFLMVREQYHSGRIVPRWENSKTANLINSQLSSMQSSQGNFFMYLFKLV